MERNNQNLSDMLDLYHSSKDFFSSGSFKEKTVNFMKMLSLSSHTDKTIIIQNADDELTVYNNEQTSNFKMHELMDVLPLLFQSNSCTKLKRSELTELITKLDIQEGQQYCDGAFFSLEMNEHESLFFIMLNKTPYTEDDLGIIERIAVFFEELAIFSAHVSQGKTLSDKLREQQKRQSVWLESLAWLNDVGNKQYTDTDLVEFYKTALFQLKTLVRAHCAVAFNINTETNELEKFIDYDDDGFSDQIINIIRDDTTFKGFSIGNYCNINHQQYPALQNIKIENVLLYPLYTQEHLKMILCVGQSAASFDDHEEMVATLFSEGLEHIIERTFFLRSMNKQNASLNKEKSEQQVLIGKLQEAQEQLLQQEKMASIGQLAAGVAHEINNPVGYVNSNINSLESYITDLYRVLAIYEQMEPKLSDQDELLTKLTQLKDDIDYDFIRDDIKDLIDESKEGVLRVKQIVKDLKDFSHVDEAEWQSIAIEKGIDSTLNIVRNELKYKANITKEFESIPKIECVPSQINQIIMNLLVNAGHAIDEQGSITIKTLQKNQDYVCIEVIDTGKGIKQENLTKIFDPFFTTKPVGQGTGLGLSLSYSIAEKHGGELSVESELGVGTTFRLTLPIVQKNNFA